jgi:pimeloyl-ACP methyl ester carboxylesterase
MAINPRFYLSGIRRNDLRSRSLRRSFHQNFVVQLASALVSFAEPSQRLPWRITLLARTAVFQKIPPGLNHSQNITANIQHTSRLSKIIEPASSSDMTNLSHEVVHQRLQLVVDGVKLDVALIRRDGPLPPIVFLHGFGSSKEDYHDIVFHPEFSDRAFIAYDAPGCGETTCEDLRKVNIEFQVETAQAVLSALKINQFHLEGHSMGGLGALFLAYRQPSRVLSFTNIKGNLASEDCFLSRQIVSHPSKDPKVFFAAFIDRTRTSPFYSNAIYASTLHHKVQPDAVRGIFESMVDLSDNHDLMDKFLSLPFPKMFMYGKQFSDLSYLKQLEANGVELAEIPESGHFPMYSNPTEMWRRIAEFLRSSEGELRGGRNFF